MPIQIAATKVLLVEGKDEKHFFEALLKSLSLTNPSVSVISVDGKGNFKHQIDALVQGPDFNAIQLLGIVRDADQEHDSAFQGLVELLKKYKLNRPSFPNTFSEGGTPRVGIFLMPGNNSEGMLENLCLRSVAETPLMECVESFMQCAISKTTTLPRIEAKAKAHAYLSLMTETVGSVGLGAKQGYWNFDHECMATLIDFVQQFCQVTPTTLTSY